MVLILRRWILAGVVGCGLLLSLPLAAQQNGSAPGKGHLSDGRNVDLDSTVRQIRRETGGRILQAETRNRDGRREHHVRIITERGKVKRYRVDAGSGEKLPRGDRKR